MKSDNKASSEVKFDIKDFLKKKKAERDAKLAGSGFNLENSCKNSHILQQNSSNVARAHVLPSNSGKPSDATHHTHGENSSQN